MKNTSRKTYVTILTLLTIFLLMIVASPVGADAFGPHDVTFVGVLNDYPNLGEQTWLYTATSSASAAISHMTFGVDTAYGEFTTGCALLSDATGGELTNDPFIDPGTPVSGMIPLVQVGTWSGDPGAPVLVPAPLAEENAQVLVDVDTNISTVGLKYENGFADGETRNYYFTLSDKFETGTIEMNVKATLLNFGGTITGPTCVPLAISLSDFGAGQPLAFNPVWFAAGLALFALGSGFVLWRVRRKIA